MSLCLACGLRKTPRCFAGDVRKADDCDAAVKLAVDTYGALDILVNAAAGADYVQS